MSATDTVSGLSICFLMIPNTFNEGDSVSTPLRIDASSTALKEELFEAFVSSDVWPDLCGHNVISVVPDFTGKVG